MSLVLSGDFEGSWMTGYCWCSAGEAGSLGGSDGISMSMIMEDFLLAYGPNCRRRVGDADTGRPTAVPSAAEGWRVLRRAGRSNDHDVVRSRAKTWQPVQSAPHYALKSSNGSALTHATENSRHLEYKIKFRAARNFACALSRLQRLQLQLRKQEG